MLIQSVIEAVIKECEANNFTEYSIQEVTLCNDKTTPYSVIQEWSAKVVLPSCTKDVEISVDGESIFVYFSKKNDVEHRDYQDEYLL